MIRRWRYLLGCVLLAGCVTLSRDRGRICFQSAVQPLSDTPSWISLAGWPQDSTGAARFGGPAGEWGAGRWWRLRGDSVEVNAAGMFTSAALRAAIERDTLAGRLLSRSDILRDSAGILVPTAQIGEWRGARAPCS